MQITAPEALPTTRLTRGILTSHRPLPNLFQLLCGGLHSLDAVDGEATDGVLAALRDLDLEFVKVHAVAGRRQGGGGALDGHAHAVGLGEGVGWVDVEGRHGGVALAVVGGEAVGPARRGPWQGRGKRVSAGV